MSVENTADIDRDLQIKVFQAVREMPGWSDSNLHIEWMAGGGAHKNFSVMNGTRKCMVKVWNRTWEQLSVMPPVGVVMENTRLAGEAGIGARVLAISQEPLAMVIEFLPSKPLDTKTENGLGRLAKAAKRLHRSGIRFARDFNPFAEARSMFACAKHLGVEGPDDLKEIRVVLDRIESTLDMRISEFVPCHNDLYGANILETFDGEIRLVDYDLAGNSDQCYDLGFISSYAEMDEDRTANFTEHYFGEHDTRQLARTHLFAIAADYCSLALWTAARAASDRNDDYDYAGEFERSLRKLRSRIDSPEFSGHLRNAAR